MTILEPEADSTLVPHQAVAVRPAPESRLLTRAEFHRLADVPPEAEWFANITNPNTRRAYRGDLDQFMRFVGIKRPEEFRSVARAHVIAWRKNLEYRKLAPATIRRKLSALADLFNHLCEENAITHNPVHGVKRPTEGANEGKTPAISDGQARQLLSAPDEKTLKGKRDRAILAVLLYHGLRRAELCALKIKHLAPRRGILTITVHGKGSKIRYIPVHPSAVTLIADYLEALCQISGTAAPEANDALFPAMNRPGRRREISLTRDSVYRNVVTVRRRRLTLRGEGVAGCWGETTIINNPHGPATSHRQRDRWDS